MKATLFRSGLLSLLLVTIAAEAEVVDLIDVSKSNCNAPCERAAVVFIHGITGSKDTWENGNNSWPNLLANDPSIGDKVDVWRIDFDSYLFFQGPSLVDVMLSLQKQLDRLFERKKYSTVFFVGHSLGGNIARAYLLHIKAKYGHRVLSRFRVTYTLGTPMLGSSLAKLATFVSRNQQFRVLLPIKVNDFQQLLNMTLLQTASKNYNLSCPGTFLVSAYEKKKIAGVIVVSEESATESAADSRGFQKDHLTLAKPQDRIDDVYKWVTESMATCLAGEHFCSEPIRRECGRLPDGWPD